MTENRNSDGQVHDRKGLRHDDGDTEGHVYHSFPKDDSDTEAHLRRPAADDADRRAPDDAEGHKIRRPDDDDLRRPDDTEGHRALIRRP